MKILLIQDVPGFGNKNDIKEVKPGYWRNFLLPRRLAISATPELIVAANKRKKENAEKELVKEKEFEREAEKIKGENILISVLADEKGGLFAGIGREEISVVLKEKFGSEIPFAKIEIEKPIKEIGLHEIAVGKVQLKIEVVRKEKAKKAGKKEVSDALPKKKTKISRK